MRRNCNKYLKFKLQKSEERVEMLKGQIRKENEVDLNEIPGFLEPKKIRPKKKEVDEKLRKSTVSCQDVIS